MFGRTGSVRRGIDTKEDEDREIRRRGEGKIQLSVKK
jgi:hypothetical protein